MNDDLNIADNAGRLQPMYLGSQMIFINKLVAIEQVRVFLLAPLWHTGHCMGRIRGANKVLASRRASLHFLQRLRLMCSGCTGRVADDQIFWIVF